MKIVVSPYHLTTREAPALAALLLADEVITLLPMGPSGGREGAREVAERSASYRELVRSWAWAEELWRSGLLRGEIDAQSAVGDVRAAAGEISDDPWLSSLRPLMHDRLFEDERGYLNALAADILKGGPDPGITVPVAAGLDRFAARAGAFVSRAHPVSLAQKAEFGLLQDRMTIIIPVLLQADASRLAIAREVLRAPLAVLRAALDGCEASRGGARGAQADDLQNAAADYAAAFEKCMGEVSRGSNDDDVRLVAGGVALTCGSLPADAVLRASLRALTAVSRNKGKALDEERPAGLVKSPSRPVSVLCFKVLGSSGAARETL
ncbi:MAG: hypothetical protein ACOYN0_06185 [Phycisphaerales bacterium]